MFVWTPKVCTKFGVYRGIAQVCKLSPTKAKLWEIAAIDLQAQVKVKKEEQEHQFGVYSTRLS